MKKLREHKTPRAWMITILCFLISYKYLEDNQFIYNGAIFAFCSLLWLITAIEETFTIIKKRLLKTNWGKKIINLFLAIILILCTGTLFAQPNLIDADSTLRNDTVVTYHGFKVCYMRNFKAPLYTCYVATKISVSGIISRSGYGFKADKQLKSHKPADFKQKNYDMGHMTPADDMAYSTASMGDCMYTTNIVPQVSNFNRGTWKSLEKYVKKLAAKYDSVYVYSGAVYTSDSCKAKSTDGKVLIPDYMWKFIFVPQQNKYVAFIFPNMADNTRFWDYVITWSEWQAQAKIYYPSFYTTTEPVELQEEKK